MIPHIIHNPDNKHREAHLRLQLVQQGIDDYTLEPHVVNKCTKTAVRQAHQNVVRKYYDEPEITIFEDDIVFTKPYSWEKYCEWKSELPDSWDVYLGGYYTARKRVDRTENLERIVSSFSGLHCYTIRKKFYDAFLRDGKDHIDIWVHRAGGVIYVPKNLPTRQMDVAENGFSEREGKKIDYSSRTKKLNFL